MVWIILILIAAVLGFGLSLRAPVTFSCGLALGTPPSVTVGVRFLFFRHHFARRKKEKPEPRRKVNRPDKDEQAKKKSASNRVSVDRLFLMLRNHQLIRDTVTACFDCVRQLIGSAEQYYLKANLRGGFRSPDLTGQLYGLVQVCRSMPSDSLALNFQPDFMASSLAGTIGAGAVFRAYRLIIQLLILIWRIPKIKLIQIYLDYRREGTRV